MKFQSFREIVAWQKARVMAGRIYALFSLNKDFGFRDQIQRASVSVLSNIAEGYGRNTNKEFIRFLEISKGSVYEVQSLSDVALDVGYFNKQQYSEVNNMAEEIIRILQGLIKSLKISKNKE